MFFFHRYENQQWTQIPSMKIERSHFALVPFEGSIYALGGMTESVEKGKQPFTVVVNAFELNRCIAYRRFWIPNHWLHRAPRSGFASRTFKVEDGASEHAHSQLLPFCCVL